MTFVKKKDMSLYEFYQCAEGMQKQYTSLRKGQSHVNVLYDVRRDLYERMHNTNADPFYADANWEQFVAFIEANWYLPIHNEKEADVKPSTNYPAVPARLDADKTAKPLTVIVGHGKLGNCFDSTMIPDTYVNNETGEKVSLKEEVSEDQGLGWFIGDRRINGS